MKMIPRNININDLRCKKCGKKLSECKPKDCIDPDCPNKPKDE